MKLRAPKLRTVRGAVSWRFASDVVEAFLTRDGGHLAPVTFSTSRGQVQPFAIAPWGDSDLGSNAAPVLKTLRGDFFCLPFGGNDATWRRERHPAHGETATRPWKLLGLDSSPDHMELSAEMRTDVRPGRVIKRLRLRPGETNIYSRHELHDFTGPMCLGHHAMLAFPQEEDSGRIALSPWREGRVCPRPFESAAQGGYSSLKTGARFRDLRRVKLAQGGFADLSSFPAREGFDDLVMVSSQPGQSLAWTAVSFPRQGYLWFALKDPRMLASTVLWHSNGGRHYPPWNGRHRCVLGLEEVTAYFHFGLVESAAKNPLSRRGIPTVLHLHPDRPVMINYVMGVAVIPRNFDSVRNVHFTDKQIEFEAVSGAKVRHRIDLGFFAPSTS
jgi:hypothetical protein